MRRFPITSLSVFALISPVFTSMTAPPQASSPQQGTTLKPINIADYEASMGLQRRGSHHLSGLDPQNLTHLVYGSPDDNGQLLLANMTLYAPDELPIVLFERFEELNISVKCQDDKGTLSLTFGSTDSWDYANRQWGYVNEADDGKFVFITNKDGCGPDDQRQPYIVSNITNNAATLTTYLAAQAVPWSDVAGSYELEFGHAVPVPHAHRLKRSVLEGNVNDTTTTFSFNISTGQPGQRTNIPTDSEGFELDCINCFIDGFFDVHGHALIKDFKLQDLTFTASPRSVFAALELEAIITATDNPKPLTYSHQLVPDLPIPGAGPTIPGIMSIGASLSYSIGGACAFSGSASVEFGVNASVPDSAQIVADYKNQEGSSVSGFDSLELTPMLHINNESASMTLSTFSQPEIKFGIDLFMVGHVDMILVINLPEFTANLSAQNGTCLLPVGFQDKKVG
ncbi:MAG: hypothetical protein Q9175_004305 [Cornicularia normoerica]